MAAATAFAAGSGVEPSALKEAASLIAAAAVLLWAGWVAQGLYGQWREESIGALDFAAGAIRIAILALLVVYFIQ